MFATSTSKKKRKKQSIQLLK